MNNFTFYSNYYELIKYLKPSDRLKIYDAIVEYMFEDKEPELKELLKGIWINIKMPLDTSKQKSLNGKKGGAPIGNQNALKTSKDTTKKQAENKQETSKDTTKKQTNNISIFLFLISNNNYKYINSNNKIYSKLEEWLKYKQERKENYKETGLKSLLNQVEKNIDIYGEDAMINLIDECMANNWAGLIYDKLPKIKTSIENKKEEEYWNE